jgi:enamine deaminase RidA (YjgF/YER057c/UK114 family)
MAKSNRRGFLTTAPVAAAAVASAAAGSAASAAERERGDADGHEAVKETHWPGREAPAEAPLFSPVVTFGDMVFLSGIGAHFEGDVKAHTAHVLDEMKTNLEAVGSSMEKVLKVNVYLNDLKDYEAMNEVFKGRFGSAPGVRTTIAAAGGIPGGSLVEIDCIAYR